MSFVTYKEKLKDLSKKVVAAQKEIRILNSIRVNPEWEASLKQSRFRDLPGGVREHYESVALGFDPEAKKLDLKRLKLEIIHVLGEQDELGVFLQTMCDQYSRVVDMLKARGTPDFYRASRDLYGSPKDCFAQDKNTISEMAHLLYTILSGVGPGIPDPPNEADVTAEQAVATLNDRFSRYFDGETVTAKLSDGIVADAAAGGDKVKIKQGAMFTQREVDLYEVHEGWVHVGTTLSGRGQPVCGFLSVGPPRCAATQEGLAVIMEIFTFRSFIRRAKQINDRIIAIEKAEDGANLLDVIEYFRTEGYTEEECLANAFRVFRGGSLDGGVPFTKDISYCKGFVENYNFLRSAIRVCKAQVIPFLFTGKLHVEDVPMLYAKHMEGLVAAPRFLPPHFQDLNGLAVWMSFSSFFNRVDLQSVQEHYKKLFDRHL
ncbi:MAG: flavohemoglobin expression-modulating QEGLA motif protein [Bdellovibrionales bacterium]